MNERQAPIDPNWITAARLPLAPLTVICLMSGGTLGFGLALGLSLLLEITDLMDGKIARKYGIVTTFGKLFDPFSDAFCRYTVFMGFLALGVADLWMLLLIFYRDSSISFIRAIGATREVVLAARYSGKVKAVVQGVGTQIIILLLLLNAAGVAIPMIETLPWGMMLLITIVTFGSFVDYLQANYQLLHDAWTDQPVK